MGVKPVCRRKRRMKVFLFRQACADMSSSDGACARSRFIFQTALLIRMSLTEAPGALLSINLERRKCNSPLILI